MFLFGHVDTPMVLSLSTIIPQRVDSRLSMKIKQGLPRISGSFIMSWSPLVQIWPLILNNACNPFFSLLSFARATRSRPFGSQYAFRANDLAGFRSISLLQHLPAPHHFNILNIRIKVYLLATHIDFISRAPTSMYITTAGTPLYWACVEYLWTRIYASWSWSRPYSQLSDDTTNNVTDPGDDYFLPTTPPTKGVIQSSSYRKSFPENDAAQLIELAIKEAEFRKQGLDKGWSKVRMESERYWFRKRSQRETTGSIRFDGGS